jgi:hypothetical protein
MSLLATLLDASTVRALLALVVVVDLLALVAIAASRSHAPKVKVIWAAPGVPMVEPVRRAPGPAPGQRVGRPGGVSLLNTSRFFAM